MVEAERKWSTKPTYYTRYRTNPTEVRSNSGERDGKAETMAVPSYQSGGGGSLSNCNTVQEHFGRLSMASDAGDSYNDTSDLRQVCD